jgi:FAD/FMN-containing dehydrogenase
MLECEVLLGDGTVITCSEQENKDLFVALPGSHGTLAIVTKATLRIMNAGPYVV